MKRNLKNFVMIYPIVSMTTVIFLSVSRKKVKIFIMVIRHRYKLASPLPKGMKAKNDKTATPKLMTLLLFLLR